MFIVVILLSTMSFSALEGLTEAVKSLAITPITLHPIVTQTIESSVGGTSGLANNVLRASRSRARLVSPVSRLPPLPLQAPVEVRVIPRIVEPAMASTIAPILKKKVSFVVDYDKEFILQGEYGSCHSFASAELVYVATGLKLSLSTLFMDHLVSPHRFGENVKDEVIRLNEISIDKNRIPKDPRLCKYMANWEFGWLKENLQLLQSRGGVVVPQNTEWSEVERIMKSIGNERIFQASSKVPLIDGKQRLSEAGISEMIQKSLAIEARDDRRRVMAATKGLRIVEFELASKTRETVIHEWVTALPEGPIYIGVNVLIFYRLIAGEKIAEIAHPLFSGHAVVIVGYSSTIDKFLIKDSNKLAILKIDAHDLVRVSRTAFRMTRN